VPLVPGSGKLTGDSGGGFAVGNWRVFSDRNVIVRADEEKHLENRLMQTLLFLCEHPGQLIRREQFFDHVWHGRVVNDEALSRAISLLRTALEDTPRNPSYIKTVPGQGYVLIAPVTPANAEVAANARADTGNKSIAVLPFVNLSCDPVNEYLSDGISEEIINALAQLPDLKVVGRTSSFSFKGVNDDIRRIGSSLDVTHILEGSLRIADDTIRVTAQLIDADNGFHLWSKNFHCDMQDIFAIQDAIAAGVVAELEKNLLGSVGKTRETTVDAYSLYLQGLYLLRSGEVDQLPKALDAFRRVTELDSEYAPAWASLADTYWYLTSYGMLQRAEVMELAEAACNRALELDDTLVDAFSCKANLCIAFSRDWEQATDAIERALLLAPANARAVLQAGNLARTLGDFEQAVTHLKKAVSLDPLNLTGHIWLANVSIALGRFEDAVEIMHQALSLNPRRVVLNAVLTNALICQGRYQAAYERALMEPAGFWQDFAMVMSLYALERQSEASECFALLLETYAEEAPFQIAEIYCCRGESDKAFAWLEKACELHDNGLVQLLASSWLKPLHTDTRWPQVLERMKIHRG
jgi:TolB-like protein/lipoprotein NlpI